MSRHSKTLQAAHLPYWFRKFSLKVSCSIIIISTSLSPLASFANAAESNIQGNQNNTPFITSDISSSSSISPMSDTVGSFNFPPAPGPIPTQSPTSTPIITEKTDSQGDSNSSDQLNLDELVFAEQKIKATLEPAIFLPGKPFTLSWNLPDWTLLEKGETRHMLITFPEGVQRTTLLTEKELNVPVETASGSVSFSIPAVVIEKFGEAVIHLQLFENDQPVGETSVSVGPPLGTFNNSKAKSLQEFNGKVKLTLPVFASDSQLALDIRKPDENSLPSLSLTGKPVQILAVDLDTGKNVKNFKKPITVEMIYDDEQIWDWQEDELKIFYFNEETKDWHPLPTIVDPKTNTLTAQTDHFTVFDYKAETWQAASLPSIDSFQVSNFTGAGTYSMPFWTPPGPGGLQPSLNLSYSSQVIDSSSLYTQASWVGAGWSLDTGSIVRIMHDTDDDTSDDTFTISVAGIGSTLLPVSESGAVTIYRTANESFNKIEYDSSTEIWTVWAKTGTVYEFDHRVKTHTTDGCAATSGDLNIIWRWSLSSVTNIHGKTLDYSYHTETKPGCANEVAVYPVYIKYPHNLYRVHFIRENRTDYKTAWEDNDSEVLYGTERLKEVRIEHDPNSTSSWNTIRKYKFTYSDNTINQIYPAFTWSGGGKTLTLVEIQETSGDGLDTLPATSFYYEDDMHLTKVENGLGGNITLEYERWTYQDDVNDDLRSMLIIFGGNECTSTVGTSWVAGPPNWGRMRCDGEYLQIGNGSDPGTGHHSIPEHITHPGGIYQFYLRLFGNEGTTDVLWGFIKQNTSPYSFTYASADNVGNNYQPVDLQEAFEIPIDYDPSDTKLRIDCSDCKIIKMQFSLQPLYFRVSSKTVQDLVTGRETTYTYQYDNPAPNDEYRSEAVAEAGQNIEDLYTYPMREYRGNQMAQVVDENHLAQTTWYYQNDLYKGSPYKTFTFRQDFWDPFTTLNTADWTTSTSGTHEISSTYSVDYDNHLRMTNTVDNWSVYLTRGAYSLTNGEVAIGHLRLSNGTTRGSFRLIGNSTDFFSIEITESNGEYKAVTRYDTGSGATNGTTLIPLGDFKPEKWYGFMFFVNTDEGSGVRIWQLDDPTNAGEEKIEGLSSYSWQFITYVIDGTLDLDAYQEGKPYSETNLVYDYEILYDTVPDNGITDLSESDLLDYIDLKVVSTETTESSTRIYEGDYSWTGTETSYIYDDHGNVTKIIEAGKDTTSQDDYVDYRKTVNEYAVNISTAYLVSLPARTRQYECLLGNCSNTELASSAWYLYDDATSYKATPFPGVLTGTRVLAESQDYIDQKFGYDAWGNLTTLTQYKNLENYVAFGSGSSITSTTIYEDVYHSYPVTVTNPLSQSITTVYDYTLGLPTTVTDPNNAVTTGEYDDFGRITSVCYPGETCTTTPNLQFIYHDSSYPFSTEVIQKINASQTFRVSKYFSGLGELLQTQILNAEVNGNSRDIITNNLYDEFGNMIQQSVPYDVPLDSGYRTPSWSSYTAFGYDVLNRLISTTAPNSNSTHTYYYDLQIKVTDPRGKSTNSYFDIWGRTTRVEPPDGTQLGDVYYSYDILGQLTTLEQGSLQTDITYDLAGRKTGMDDPDMGTWSYTYDALGNLTSQIDARNSTIYLSYDNLSRLTQKCSDPICATSLSTYTYDSVTNGIGRRADMSYGSDSTSWSYDSRGRVLSEEMEIDSKSFTTSWTYNSADMVASITYPDDEVVEFDYNNQKALIGMANTETTPFVYISDVNYDSAGRLTGVDLGESGYQAIIAREFEYFPWGTTQDGGMLQSLASSQVGGVTLQNLAYDYDSNGNILEITDYLNQEVSSYAYDNLNRLTSADVEDFSSLDVFEEYYEYSSAIGNLTAKGSSPTSLNDYVYDPGHPHAVSEYGNLNTYEYDENGNQITRQINEDDYNLIYDAENRLISVSSTGISTPTPTATSTVTQIPTQEITPTTSNTPTNTPTLTYTPGNTPTPSPTGVPAYKLSTGYLSNVGSTWQTVTLPDTYSSMVVVASPNYDNSDSPAVVRIKNASGSSFEIKVQNPGETTLSGYTVHYMVFEEGVYTEANDGVKMEAVKYTSTVTDENNSWGGQARTYQQSYTSPVVLGQVMTENDANWSVFWSRGSSQHNPPDSSNLYTGKHVGEDTNISRADETIGYIVIEAGSGYFGQKTFVADLGSDVVSGIGNSPPYTYTLSGPSGATYAIASQAGMDGGDGGWAVLYGSDPVSPTALDLACDEDQIANSERGHTTEQLGYLVIGEPLPTHTPTHTLTPTITYTPGNTPSPTPSDTPTASLTQTATNPPSNTPTVTSTPTLTYTPSLTPTPTQTGTVDPTPTATEPTPAPLESAQYTYDGDGKLVKSVVNGVTTYYVGGIYEMKVDNTIETERKYYSLGGGRFAVRGDGVLNWILSDHLGSTSISAHADGSWRGEIAYTPFGEMRVSRGMTLTDYRYTGQRLEAEVGLYFYQARWMDPVVGRFTQADTLIPDPGNPLSLDRYAYVYNNPVKYIDPTGHWMSTNPTIRGASGYWVGGLIDPLPQPPTPPRPPVPWTNIFDPGDSCSPSPFPNPCTPEFIPPEPTLPLDLEEIFNPALSTSGLDLYEFLEGDTGSIPIPPYTKQYNPPNLPDVLHPPRSVYTGSYTPVLGLAVDIGGVVTDGAAVLSVFVPITLPAAAEMQLIMTGMETTYYVWRLKEGYPEDAFLGVAQKQADMQSLVPYVGFSSSLWGICLDFAEINQGLTIIPY